MHEALLAQGALPAPTYVFGMLMRPYSLGHELQLLRESNPLVSGGGANAKREDLAQAVLICCQSFEECRRMHLDWFLPLKVWLWRRRVKRFPTEPHIRAFVEYRETGSLEFPLSEGLKPGRSTPRYPGAPFLLRLYQFVAINLGVGHATAWDYPYGLAKMQWAAYWEQEGGLEIYNWVDAEHDTFVARMEAEEAEKGPNA